MKKYLILAAAAMAVLSACNKTEMGIPTDSQSETVIPKFSVKIENTTKTTIEGNKVNWSDTDNMYISFYHVRREQVGYNPFTGAQYAWIQAGGESKAIFDVVPKQEDASHADLEFSAFLLERSDKDLSIGDWHVTAVYPSSMVQSSDGFNTTKMVFPAVQTYQSNDIGFAPMYYSGNETSFTMKNAAALLKITVPHNIGINSVEKITVSSDKWMNGVCEFSNDVLVKSTDTANCGEQDADANKMITLDCKTYSSYGVFTDSNPSFYIAIPAQHYDYLEITIDDNHTMRTKKASGIDVECNKIYPITFLENHVPGSVGTATRTGDVSVNWVQLWENGPKFATYNVGAENNRPEDFGGYYCWGSSIDKDANRAYYTGDGNLPDSYDTATNLWGSNWRMPTDNELYWLLRNCDITFTEDYNGTGVKGAIITGHVPYASNSIFLPAAGTAVGADIKSFYEDICRYWSSTRYPGGGSIRAYYLDLNINNNNTYDESGRYGLSVRAVLAEHY